MSSADRRSTGAAGAETLVLELPNDIASIEGAVDHAVEHCAPAGLDRRRLLFNFRVGLTEAISNAILYGNSGDSDKRVRVELKAVPGEVRVRVSDQGEGFDPEAVPDPRLPENVILPDGRGVFLMRALMDEVRFNRTGNAVTLVLRERPATAPPEVGLPQLVAETLEEFSTLLGLEIRAWEAVGGRRVPVHRSGGDETPLPRGHRFPVRVDPDRVLDVEVAGQGPDSPLIGILACFAGARRVPGRGGGPQPHGAGGRAGGQPHHAGGHGARAPLPGDGTGPRPAVEAASSDPAGSGRRGSSACGAGHVRGGRLLPGHPSSPGAGWA